MNRREFLKLTGLAGTGAAISPSTLDSLYAKKRFQSIPRQDTAAHVVHRLTFGPKPGLVEKVRQIGVDAFIEEQLYMESSDNRILENQFSSIDVLHMSAAELMETYEERRFTIIQQLIGVTLLRAIYSERQLFEVMVHFWSDHLHTTFQGGPAPFLKPVYDRDIRQHTLGKFRDLLGASAKSPSMLFYLDNALSDKDAPNENYARELLELHTLGVDGGYTESDIKEVARCFTGWTIVPPRFQASEREAGTFIFNPRNHDTGEKQVLDQVIPAGGGIEDGEKVLDILASHTSTAQFISRKLARRFIADEPPKSIVESCAAAFSASDGDIRTVLRTLFTSQEFQNAPPKFRRPFEYVVGTLRLLNYKILNPDMALRPVGDALRAMGHVPFTHPSPDGFPDVQQAWLDGLLMRWNAALAAVYGSIPGTYMSVRDLLPDEIPQQPQAILNYLGSYVMGRDMTADEATILSAYIENADLSTEAGVQQMKDVLAILIASPAYQYR